MKITNVLIIISQQTEESETIPVKKRINLVFFLLYRIFNFDFEY